MHETIPNTSGVTRYSVDFRTVHKDDLASRRGARNVDSRCTGTTLRDYLRGTDLGHLPQDLIESYDDSTEVEGVLIHPENERAERELTQKSRPAALADA